MKVRNSPVIVIGTHRSGTSLLAKMLHECGVFMGARRNHHSEAKFFLRRNKHIFNVAHASWDNAAPTTYLLQSDDMRSALVAHLTNELKSHKAIDYLGLTNYARSRGFVGMDRLWGWKDPRNTYSLPIWLDIFPNARVVRIGRNGVDVAHSLWKREQDRRRRSSWEENPSRTVGHRGEAGAR